MEARGGIGGTERGRISARARPSVTYLIGRLDARFTQNCYQLQYQCSLLWTSGARCKQPTPRNWRRETCNSVPIFILLDIFHHLRPNLETKADPRKTFWDYTDSKVSLAVESHIQAPDLDCRSLNPSISRRQNDSRFPTRAALPTHDDGLYAHSSRPILAK